MSNLKFISEDHALPTNKELFISINIAIHNAILKISYWNIYVNTHFEQLINGMLCNLIKYLFIDKYR